MVSSDVSPGERSALSHRPLTNMSDSGNAVETHSERCKRVSRSIGLEAGASKHHAIWDLVVAAFGMHVVLVSV